MKNTCTSQAYIRHATNAFIYFCIFSRYDVYKTVAYPSTICTIYTFVIYIKRAAFWQRFNHIRDDEAGRLVYPRLFDPYLYYVSVFFTTSLCTVWFFFLSRDISRKIWIIFVLFSLEHFPYVRYFFHSYYILKRTDETGKRRQVTCLVRGSQSG